MIYDRRELDWLFRDLRQCVQALEEATRQGTPAEEKIALERALNAVDRFRYLVRRDHH